ncbi:MAG: uL15 family ribosomal protein [Cyanobium sp.]
MPLGPPHPPRFRGGADAPLPPGAQAQALPLVNPTTYTVLNVGRLSDLKAGSTVNLTSLVEAGLLTNPAKDQPLKILGNGELNVKLTVQADAFSDSARRKIEAAGGTCETLA